MAGRITFESVPNELTSFTVTFPLYRTQNVPTSNFSFLPEEPDSIARLDDNPTILLVDDDKLQAKWLGNDLRILGCQVSIANSIEQANEVLKLRQPDVILLDSFTPKFTEALGFVKQCAVACKIIPFPSLWSVVTYSKKAGKCLSMRA
ncbi:hypothetical protein [Paraflavitalea speifideaquila]|uniref:response regulator n=1 Tax=Paraflavitalea speifideaquila TaxID=3076558 RepID=UPI0028F0F03A|nr:hypothetical protein [Paraflavitalea speifideiaquila]